MLNWVKKVTPMIYDAVYDKDGFIDCERTIYAGVEVQYLADCGLFILGLKPRETSEYDTTPTESDYDNSTFFYVTINCMGEEFYVGSLSCDGGLGEASESVFSLQIIQEKFREFTFSAERFFDIKKECSCLLNPSELKQQ
jgi:hypothetical protein